MQSLARTAVALSCLVVACLESSVGQVADVVDVHDVGRGDVPPTEVVPSTGTSVGDAVLGSDSHVTPLTGLVVHEWGTFTSVQGSDGVSVPGLHHEDEALPPFVHRRNLTDRNNYYFEELPEEPLQQLETPVLYFHARERTAVRVVVDFPEGVVSQWYPDASAFEPALEALTEVGQGSMTWEVTVDPAIDPATFPEVSPDEIWAPSRRVAATPVEAETAWGTQRERFIFYRGLGSFDMPVRVTAPSDARVVVSNDSADTLAEVVLLRSTATGGAVVALGALAAHASRAVEVPAARPGREAFEAEARAELFAAIVATGLYADEAQAMVDTWTRSWLGNEGLRILYIVPAAWTDALLPIRIEPAPDELVRTLVGRVEIMTPGVEAATRAAITRLGAEPGWGELDAIVGELGRFAEPRVRRALGLELDAGVAARGRALLDAAHARP